MNNTRKALLGAAVAAALLVTMCCASCLVIGVLGESARPGALAPTPVAPSDTSTTREDAGGADLTVPGTTPAATRAAPLAPAQVPPTVDTTPVTAAAADAERTSIADEGFPGIVARRSYWNATHSEMPGFSPGAVYGPLLRGGNPMYASVQGDDRILLYVVNLPEGTSWRMAQVAARAELPRDAEEVSTHRLGACRFIRYRSQILRELLRDSARRGELSSEYPDLSVAFFSDSDVFDPDRVSNMSVSFHYGDDVGC